MKIIMSVCAMFIVQASWVPCTTASARPTAHVKMGSEVHYLPHVKRVSVIFFSQMKHRPERI